MNNPGSAQTQLVYTPHPGPQRPPGPSIITNPPMITRRPGSQPLNPMQVRGTNNRVIPIDRSSIIQLLQLPVMLLIKSLKIMAVLTLL